MPRMDLTALGSVQWLRDVNLSSGGIWMVKAHKVAIGIVLLATWKDQITVVRKESVKGYEFSELLALPGGIIRGHDASSFVECLEQTVLLRAEDEAGLKAEDLSDLEVLAPNSVPVTRYTAKGAERFTAVLAARASLTKEVQLSSRRRSIHETFFASLPLDWKAFAPANRLILAAALVDRVGAEERAQNERVIDDAWAFCNGAAEAAGLPMSSHPWR